MIYFRRHGKHNKFFARWKKKTFSFLIESNKLLFWLFQVSLLTKAFMLSTFIRNFPLPFQQQFYSTAEHRERTIVFFSVLHCFPHFSNRSNADIIFYCYQPNTTQLNRKRKQKKKDEEKIKSKQINVFVWNFCCFSDFTTFSNWISSSTS